MIRLNAKKTYPVIKYVLKEKCFKQSELSEKTGVSLGRVNEIVQWLSKRGVIQKTEQGYKLVNPLWLIRAFTIFRDMSNQRFTTLEVNIERKKLMNHLKRKHVVFCLTTALQEYSSYFRDPSVNFYARDYEKIKRELTPRTGNLLVNIFKPDLFLETDIVKKDGLPITSKIRTVIDLFCDKKAYTARDLVKELWGVDIG